MRSKTLAGILVEAHASFEVRHTVRAGIPWGGPWPHPGRLVGTLRAHGVLIREPERPAFIGGRPGCELGSAGETPESLFGLVPGKGSNPSSTPWDLVASPGVSGVPLTLL